MSMREVLSSAWAWGLLSWRLLLLLQQVQLYTSPSQWHLRGVQADSYPWIHTLQCGGAVWDSTAHVPSAQWWGTARAGNTWLVIRGNSPVPSALYKVQLKSPAAKGRHLTLDTLLGLRASGGQEWQEPSGRGRAWDSQDCCAHTSNAVQLALSSVP